MVLRRKPDVLLSLAPIIKENPKYQGQDKLPVIVWMISLVAIDIHKNIMFLHVQITLYHMILNHEFDFVFTGHPRRFSCRAVHVDTNSVAYAEWQVKL